ncbi:MAG: hypothetical protein BWY47_01539 [Bacteroidetes bacterium ADurb.Bin302]|jgi:regulatory protein YycH of two-component signal transduction system YycFG|nr:MAG: hypothetical protein BWY47_01539 [Bacteroidetes bacterium ADurb.Bin302]
MTTEEEFDRQEAEYEKQVEERTLSPKATELIQSLNDFVNSGGSHRELQKIAKSLAQRPQHRTLQQSIVKLFIMSLEEMANLPENATDARNKESRLIATQMIEGFKKVRSEFDSELHGRPINDAALPSQYIPFV